MKNLRFEKLELISTIQKAAKAIKFHPMLTVIKGENDVGKSSAIKSLYWAFGTTVQLHPTWLESKVKVHVTFTVDGVRHSILRDGQTIGLFDEDGNLIISTNSITKELAPVLAELLDFQLVLSDRQGEPSVPPPAFALLPFYMDQDKGWQQTLESFLQLQQYKDYRKSIIEFHSGILPNEYYKLQAEKRKIDMERSALVHDRAVVEKAISKLDLEASFTGIELTEADHEKSIEQLLERIKKLRETRQKRALEFSKIVDQRTLLLEQMAITEAALRELTKDFEFTQDLETEVLCPTCGTTHYNDFANRFALLDDREACVEYLKTSQEELRSLATSASKTRLALTEVDTTMAEVSEMLEQKRGELTLKQVIEAEGRRTAATLFNAQLDELSLEIASRTDRIAKIEAALKPLRDPKRRKAIERYYAGYMLGYLKKLDVQNINFTSAAKIEKKVNDTGSDQPRAVLAYQLALLQTIYQYSDALSAPMVIDSPNQQDQSAKNIAEMIDLIFSSRPDQGQTILGTVSLHDQPVTNGIIITLEDKLSILQQSEYEKMLKDLAPYFDKMNSDSSGQNRLPGF